MSEIQVQSTTYFDSAAPEVKVQPNGLVCLLFDGAAPDDGYVCVQLTPEQATSLGQQLIEAAQQTPQNPGKLSFIDEVV
jgi:hypothetical protein